MCFFHEGRIFLRKGKKDLEAMKIFMNEENEMNVLRFFKKETRTKMCFIKGGFFPPKKKLERIRIMKKKIHERGKKTADTPLKKARA